MVWTHVPFPTLFCRKSRLFAVREEDSGESVDRIFGRVGIKNALKAGGGSAGRTANMLTQVGTASVDSSLQSFSDPRQPETHQGVREINKLVLFLQKQVGHALAIGEIAQLFLFAGGMVIDPVAVTVDVDLALPGPARRWRYSCNTPDIAAAHPASPCGP